METAHWPSDIGPSPKNEGSTSSSVLPCALQRRQTGPNLLADPSASIQLCLVTSNVCTGLFSAVLPTLHLFVNTSSVDREAHLNDLQVGMRWTVEDKRPHINNLEFKAVILAVSHSEVVRCTDYSSQLCSCSCNDVMHKNI